LEFVFWRGQTMIISENKTPALDEFHQLMEKTDKFLNADAAVREDYYCGRNGTKLEDDVYSALTECAVGTSFQGTIRLISGASFPDIVIFGYYGVEVKSTNKDHWKSIGSSILESTRNPNVKRIYLTFGKLGKPVKFLSRPYEECLSGIAVTHYPRYQIDMKLKIGETIFDKMGITYDELRKMDNPVIPVSKYYKSQLKDGESLWWVADDPDHTNLPATVKLWSALTPAEKNNYTAQGYALFPEIFSESGSTKYQRFALWLATQCGIINTNIRDQFSAGGKTSIAINSNTYIQMPAVFGRIEQYKELILKTILNTPENVLYEYWNVPVATDRVLQWCDLAAQYASKTIGYRQAYSFLTDILNIHR
ncbi:MAG: hypothetical protein ACI3YK_01520, partial [Eubacteriales bacterium]